MSNNLVLKFLQTVVKYPSFALHTKSHSVNYVSIHVGTNISPRVFLT